MSGDVSMKRTIEEIARRYQLSAEVVQALQELMTSALTPPAPEAGAEVTRTASGEALSLPGSELSAGEVARVDGAMSLASESPSIWLLEEQEDTPREQVLGGVMDPLLEETTRYSGATLLGIGGMGVVYRVRDRLLGRAVAMKVLGEHLAHSQSARARFLEEAQVGAQLQHPGLVPVHDLGTLKDGRPFFTMKEVRGQSVWHVIQDLHGAVREEQWQTTASGWTLRRLLGAFVRVCEAVGYAHHRRVIHRDLKPSNIMVGEQGEVLVVDWGVARVLGQAQGGVTSHRAMDHSGRTGHGGAPGTLAYMSPEQRRGLAEAQDPRADVYALGGILRELLTGAPPDREGTPPAPVPDILMAVCAQAMAAEQRDRPESAWALGRAVQEWLDGARRREQALALVDEARAQRALAIAHLEASRALEARASAALREVPRWAPEAEKAPLWEALDEAARLTLEGDRADLEMTKLINGALTLDPECVEAHVELTRYHEAHYRATSARDHRRRQQAVFHMRNHIAALPPRHSVRVDVEAFLEGAGALTLITEPVAEATLLRYETYHRRRVAVFDRALGQTPLIAAPLAYGSYVIELRAPGHELVRYPVAIDRQEHWDGVAPGEREARVIKLPRVGALTPEEVYVPAGWFRCGGDAEATDSLPAARAWVDGFVMQRDAMSNARCIDFLNDLVEQGREQEALQFVPRERASTLTDLGAMIYGRDDAGRFFLQPDADGDLWRPEWPAFMVTWFAAVGYCDWLASRTGQGWRLPGGLEWEKAARGVDGRLFPWGDEGDPSWCSNLHGRAKPSITAPEEHPIDTSPYGVRGMAGNVMAWCQEGDYEPLPGDGYVRAARVDPATLEADAMRQTRGGTWATDMSFCRLARRRMSHARINTVVSAHPVRPWPL
jgi:eukaryotic-like serine/threonine-protein kinase